MLNFKLMQRCGILGAMVLCGSVACSASSERTNLEQLPLVTDDPSANPAYYDTQIVTRGPDGVQKVRYQHTTPEQWAREVAAHTGKVLPTRGTVSPGESVGSSSSADTTQDSGCGNDSLWVFNYDRRVLAACSLPSNGYEKRICFNNPDTLTQIELEPSNHAVVDLNSYPLVMCSPTSCFTTTWLGNVGMFWPGSDSGSFGYVYLVLYGGQYHQVWQPVQSITAGGACTAATFHNDGSSLALL